MITPDFKWLNNNTDHQLKDLPPISVMPSRLWLRLQRSLKLLFINLGFIALQPYLFSGSQYFLLFWLAINFSFWFLLKNNQSGKKLPTELSVKNSIWRVRFQDRIFYCELRSEIVCWQWVIVIPLFCPQSRKTLSLVVFKDSLSVKDNSSLRRWIHLQSC